MTTTIDVQYVTNAEEPTVSVIIPIDLWRDLLAECETAHLLKSATMRQRLRDAKARTGGRSLEDVRVQRAI